MKERGLKSNKLLHYLVVTRSNGKWIGSIFHRRRDTKKERKKKEQLSFKHLIAENTSEINNYGEQGVKVIGCILHR